MAGVKSYEVTCTLMFMLLEICVVVLLSYFSCWNSFVFRNFHTLGDQTQCHTKGQFSFLVVDLIKHQHNIVLKNSCPLGLGDVARIVTTTLFPRQNIVSILGVSSQIATY